MGFFRTYFEADVMDPNPYESPADDDARAVVDREQRDGLADTIRQFMEEKLTAFEFDEALDDYRSSGDPTVKHVAFHAWFYQFRSG